MTQLKTGELAKRAGVNVETLRFYERKGLLPEPPRRDSGYREYPEESVGRIRFIKRAQELGFSLDEIHELLALRVRQDSPCARVKAAAEKKIEDVQQKIADLQAIKRALTKLAVTCSGKGPVSGGCPILENLDSKF